MRATEGFRVPPVWDNKPVHRKENPFDALEREMRPAPLHPYGSVLVLVVSQERRRTILVREEGRRDPKWRVPGGSLERGESPVQAAAREIEEETGIPLRVDQVTILAEERRESQRYYPHFCIAEVTEAQFDHLVPRTQDGDKTLETRTLHIDEVVQLPDLLRQHRERIEELLSL